MVFKVPQFLEKTVIRKLHKVTNTGAGSSCKSLFKFNLKITFKGQCHNIFDQFFYFIKKLYLGTFINKEDFAKYALPRSQQQSFGVDITE